MFDDQLLRHGIKSLWKAHCCWLLQRQRYIERLEPVFQDILARASELEDISFGFYLAGMKVWG